MYWLIPTADFDNVHGRELRAIGDLNIQEVTTNDCGPACYDRREDAERVKAELEKQVPNLRIGLIESPRSSISEASQMAAKQKPEEFDDDGYRLAPIELSEDGWLYETRKGIAVMKEGRTSTGQHVMTTEANIPWKTLCDLVDRHRNLNKKGRHDDRK